MVDDIRLISILAPQNVQASPIAQGGGSQVPGIIINLPPGSILSGFIINRDAAGNPILRSDSGDITFHSDIFLKIGSEVVIRLVNAGGTQHARILSIDGQPPQTAAATPGATAKSEVIVSARLQPETPTAQPIPVRATLLSPPPPMPTVTAPPLPAHTELALKIVSLAPPQQPSATPAAPTPQQPAAAPSLYAAYSRAAGAPAPVSAAAAPTVAPPAAPVAQTVTAPVAATPTAAIPDPRAELLALAAAVKNPPPPQPAAAPAMPSQPMPAPAVGQTIVATVVGHEPSGETLVHTPLGIMRLQTPTPLVNGSKMTLDIVRITPPTTGMAALAPTTAPITEIASNWGSLQQIAQLLAARNPTAAAWVAPWLPPMQSTAAPTITPQTISSGLMLFIAALRGGDFSNWLGKDNVQWLQNNGHETLVKKAEAEFIGLSRTFSEAPAASQAPWQATVFPLAVAGQWQQLRIFVKRDRDPDKKQQGKKQEDTRFVIEMTLSQLGEMQMDGFVRRQPKGVEFDLFIRSRSPLEVGIQQEIQRIYSNTADLAGYRGSLVFQAVREFPVRPMEEIAEHMAGVIA